MKETGMNLECVMEAKTWNCTVRIKLFLLERSDVSPKMS